ncbi:MAG: Amuc_1100 family pilus-like protein [Roseimicrobium sp.]
MNWAQENKSLAAIVGVMIVGAVALGVWLFLSWSSYAVAVETWSDVDRQLAALRGGPLAPTEANVAAKEQLVGSYLEKVGLLRAALLSEKVQQAVKPVSQTDFQAKLKDRTNAVKGAAASAGLRLPEDFALAFDDYTNSVPRTPEVASKLSVHLDVIEKLVTALIDAGVNSVEVLERTKLADESATALPKPVESKSKSKTVKSKKSKGAKTYITAEAAAEPVLDRYPLKLLFTADQGPFQAVMNTLQHPGKMPHFLVVRQVRVENSRLDGPTKAEVSQKRPQATTETAPPPEQEAATAPTEPQGYAPPKPATADAVAIMGSELLKVYLEIDYVRFRPVAEEADEEPAAKP